MSRKLFVLGTSAYPGSGQDEFADQLASRYGVTIHRSGDMMRRIAVERGTKPTREALQAIRRELDVEHGRDHLPRMLAETIEAAGQQVVVTGIRTLEEERMYRERFDFRLLFVTSNEVVRYERVMRRKEAKDPVTREAFLAQMAAEAALFDLPELERKADERFDCGMPLEEFREEFGRLVAPLACVRELIARLTEADGKLVLSQNVVYSGVLFEVVKRLVETRSSGRRTVHEEEVVRRPPGVRILTTNGDKVLVIREYRVEHGTWDYRLPGGKVYDRFDQFREATEGGRDLAVDARAAAARELAEEGNVTADELRPLMVSRAVASVEWDLYYFHCPRWHIGTDQRPDESELIRAEWVTAKLRVPSRIISFRDIPFRVTRHGR